MPTAPLELSHVERQFSEIKDILIRIQEQIRVLEIREAGASPLVNSKLDALWRKADADSGRIGTLETRSIQQAGDIKNITGALAIIGAAVILFIVNSILHTVFPGVP